MLKIFMCKVSTLKVFIVLGGLRKFNLRSMICCVCERGTWRSFEDLATFEATMFIAPYGKQPLEKNWRVIVVKMLYVLILCS